MPTNPAENITEERLREFRNTEQWHSHSSSEFLFSDGCQFLYDHGAAWLIEAIISYQQEKEISRSDRLRHFQLWKIRRCDDDTFALTCHEASGNGWTFRREISCSGFPLYSIELCVNSGVILLRWENSFEYSEDEGGQQENGDPMATNEDEVLGCGHCCTHMGSPPFLHKQEYERMPREIADEVQSYLFRVMNDWEVARGGKDLPCFWLDQKTMLCKNYEYRPNVCRDAACDGDSGCLITERGCGGPCRPGQIVAWDDKGDGEIKDTDEPEEGVG